MSDKVNDTLNIGGNVVKQALDAECSRGNMTEEQADLMWWYFAFSKDSKWSLTDAAHEISMTAGTLSKAWNGKYGASYDNICNKIRRMKVIVEDRSKRAVIDHVETSISKRVWEACHAALISQTIVQIYGESQIGKTAALEEYTRRNNHGQTRYVRLPASAGVQLFAKEMARSCYVSAHSSFEGLRDRILASLDDRNLVILDEIHQVFSSYQNKSQIKVIEFIREIFDRTHCGMVLCGTNIFRDEIMHGKMKRLLAQLRKRGIIRIQLPDYTPKKDLLVIANAFGLGDPTDEAWGIIKDHIHESGVGMYIKYLQSGARMADKNKQKFTWDHYVKAYNIILKLSEKGTSK